MKSANAIEAQLFEAAQELNRQYFADAVQILGVRFAQFSNDFRAVKKYKLVQVTLGAYDLETRWIYVNRFFLWALRLGLYFEEVRFIMFHELCHAFLANALQPYRLGLYHPEGGSHGSDFKRLEDQYPNKPNLDNVGIQVLSWMRATPWKEVTIAKTSS